MEIKAVDFIVALCALIFVATPAWPAPLIVLLATSACAFLGVRISPSRPLFALALSALPAIAGLSWLFLVVLPGFDGID